MTKRDETQAAADVVRNIITKHEQPLPADVEAAWTAWIGSIQHVDARAKVLLRAAFEVGVEAGKARK
jgi:hypothetical protein